MRNNIPGITMVPIHTEMQALIRNHATDPKNELPQKIVDVLIRYCENEEVMHLIGQTFFDHWEAGGRILTVRQFTDSLIKDVVSAYS